MERLRKKAPDTFLFLTPFFSRIVVQGSRRTLSLCISVPSVVKGRETGSTES